MKTNELKQLSIIIPHYNTPKLLRRLLLSIPYEVETIVVDDKSTDDLSEYAKLVNEFANVSFYSNETDKKGAGVCRNIGIAHAAGKWVLFADADDYFTENFYKTVSKYFDAKEDLICFTPTSIEETTGELSHRHLHYETIVKNYLKDPTKKNTLTLRYEFPSPLCKMIRRSLVITENVLFDEIKNSEDYIFSTKVGYFAKKFLAIDETIYVFTESQGSLSKKMSCERYSIHVQAFINVHNFLKAHLTKDEMKILDMAGLGFLFYGVKHKIKLSTLWKVFKRLKKNRIPIFKRKYKNPATVFKILKFNLGIYRKEKDYYVKE